MCTLVFFMGTDILQLGDEGQFQVTYDCSIIAIYQPCDSHIIFLHNSLFV